MTASDVRTAAQAEAERLMPLTGGVLDSGRETWHRGFTHGAVWGAALVTPTQEQIAEALWRFPINAITLSELREKAATGNGDYEETLDYLMHQADAVLVLMRAQAGEARAANP